MRKAERRAASREQRAVEHARLINERLQEPRRFSSRERRGDGVDVVHMNDEMRDFFVEQRSLFEAQFGREPGPDDPVFFDPKSDVPRQADPLTLQEMLDIFTSAGIDPAFAYAFHELDYVVTEANKHMFNLAEVEAFEESVQRHAARLALEGAGSHDGKGEQKGLLPSRGKGGAPKKTKKKRSTSVRGKARAKIEQNLLERARVRTVGSIQSLPDDSAPLDCAALAAELDLDGEEVVARAGGEASTGDDGRAWISLETAKRVIRLSLKQLSSRDRLMSVPARPPKHGLFRVADAATWVGIPASELWWRADGGWDSIIAATVNDGLDSYESSGDGASYADLVAAHEGSDVAWEMCAPIQGRESRTYVTTGMIDHIAKSLNVDLPWSARVILDADDEVN